MDEEVMPLGGNIELVGFRDVDPASMIVVKKMVGLYAKKLSETTSAFEKLRVTLKKIHERETSEKYELHSMMAAGGDTLTSEETSQNLFIALDATLKKLENQVGK
ncbi:hypothetical protein COY95_01730 [Candidatus Woesearchaeota archaeon CG_4_10_14_0_8_um_filter_47_5]|nr:MAG: hypothetical protein COY95_01730 [Candidatus Woesearchaeota archaeon CG_4_10_14_0_8_um_filter_47_5]